MGLGLPGLYAIQGNGAAFESERWGVGFSPGRRFASSLLTTRHANLIRSEARPKNRGGMDGMFDTFLT